MHLKIDYLEQLRVGKCDILFLINLFVQLVFCFLIDEASLLTTAGGAGAGRFLEAAADYAD